MAVLCLGSAVMIIHPPSEAIRRLDDGLLDFPSQENLHSLRYTLLGVTVAVLCQISCIKYNKASLIQQFS